MYILCRVIIEALDLKLIKSMPTGYLYYVNKSLWRANRTVSMLTCSYPSHYNTNISPPCKVMLLLLYVPLETLHMSCKRPQQPLSIAVVSFYFLLFFFSVVDSYTSPERN